MWCFGGTCRCSSMETLINTIDSMKNISINKTIILFSLLCSITVFVQAQSDAMTETWQTPDSPVFVTLGGTTLTQADLDAYIQDRIPEKHQAGFLSDPNRIASVVQQQLLQLLLAHQGIKHGLDEEPEIAALLYHKAMSELAKQEIKRYLAEHQLDSYSAQAEELAIVEPDAVQSEMFTVSFDQLLVTGQDDESRLDTAVRMADLYERYKEGELDFDALIKHSDDPALDDNNGRYADVEPDRLDDVVAAQLSELEPGEISEPFESRYGWHMVRLVSRNYRELSEEERLERFEEIARSRHENSLRQTYLNSLLNQPFEIAPNAVRDLMARHGVELDSEQEKEITDQLAPEAAEDS